MVLQERLDIFENYLTSMTSCNPATVKKYRAILRMFLYDNLAKIEDPSTKRFNITIDLINEWIVHKNSTKSTYHYKYALSQFLISIGRKDLVDKLAIARKKPRKKVFKFINKGKLEQMINSLPSKYKPLALIQLKTGGRIGSVFTLRAENIDFNAHPKLIYIKIGVNKTLSKRSKELTLKLNKKYEGFLRKYIKRPYGYLFLDEDCEKMDEESLLRELENQRRYYDKELEQVGNMFGVEGFSSHYLRHVFADYFLEAGGDPVYLKEAMGHSKIDTTLGYVSIQDKMVDKAILAMEGEI